MPEIKRTGNRIVIGRTRQETEQLQRHRSLQGRSFSDLTRVEKDLMLEALLRKAGILLDNGTIDLGNL